MSPTVDPTNENLAAAWDGDEGKFFADNAVHFDRAIASFHTALMEGAAIQPNDRVLDVGCGTGQVTRDAALVAAEGSALGVDLSAAMLAVARDIAASEGISNVRFEQADAQIHPFEPGCLDVVVSRNGTMFFGDPLAAFSNLAQSLSPDGRLTMLVWQGPEPNEWMREIRRALAVGRDIPGPPLGKPGPLAYADPDDAHRVLTSTGFTDVHVDGVEAPMWFGDDADDAQRFQLGQMGWMLRDLDEAGARRAQADLHALFTAHTGPEGVTFAGAAWLVQARRA